MRQITLHQIPLHLKGSTILLALALLVPPFFPASAADEVGFRGEAKMLLEQEKAKEALGVARKGLEYHPDDLELLDMASSASRAVGLLDESLWYAALALATYQEQRAEADPDEPVDEATTERVKKFRERIAEIDPFLDRSSTLIDDYAAKLLDVAEHCRKKKYYVNAVDLLTQCRGTGVEDQANANLDAIYQKKSAEQALISSGMDVPLRRRKLSRKKLARLDARHKEWPNAEEIKTSNYTVVTNMGHELGSSVANAMEQMNRFYRKVFQHKMRGGGTARCTINIYKARSEFDEHEGYADKPTARGFFQPGKNRVCTYDPATDGRPTAALWSTLFHEASHQFTFMVSADKIPGWLNEGTASYFEGARLLPSGLVRTNLIPDGRLRNLKKILDRGSPSLKEVLSFFEYGSYPGSYYPVGWGMVYFARNFEDDECNRPYLRPYQSLLKSYKSAGKHDPFQRFEEYFIKKTRVDGVKTFADFEKLFKSWIYELHDVHFGPPDRADVLLAKARKQKSFKKYEEALETYQWALEKRPGDIVAAFERAEVLAADRKRKDEALYSYRRALTSARSAPDPDKKIPGLEQFTPETLAAECIQRIQKLDKTVAQETATATAKVIDSITGIARDYVDKGLPRRAMHVLEIGGTLAGDHRDLTGLHEKIKKEKKIETRRWRRLAFDPALEDWSGRDVWSHQDRDTVAAHAVHAEFLTRRHQVDDDFRYEVTLRPRGELEKDAVMGFSFGSNNFSGQKMLVIFGTGNTSVAKLDDGLEILTGLGRLPEELLRKELRLAVEVEGNKASFFLGEQKIGEHEFAAGELEGRLGLVAQNCAVEFSDLRALY